MFSGVLRVRLVKPCRHHSFRGLAQISFEARLRSGHVTATTTTTTTTSTFRYSRLRARPL